MQRYRWTEKFYGSNRTRRSKKSSWKVYHAKNLFVNLYCEPGHLRRIRYPCRAESADLKILIADSSLHVGSLDANSDLQSFSRQLLNHKDNKSSRPQGLSELKATDVFDREGTIVVMNKTDLLPPGLTDRRAEIENVPLCWISCKTGDGVEAFMDRMKQLLEKM